MTRAEETIGDIVLAVSRRKWNSALPSCSAGHQRLATVYLEYRRREMLKRCSKCILPETYPDITFDEKGVCIYCLTHKRAKVRGEAALNDLIEPHRDSNREYDCIVALSGGRDSAFVAHYAVRVLNLRVLAYTFDNGFMPEQTRENIKNIVDLLGIDHVIEKYDYVEKKAKHIMSSWIRKPSPAMVALLCTGCKTGYTRGVIKTVQNHPSLPVIVGSGEPEQSFAERLLSLANKPPEITRSRRKKHPIVLGFLMEISRNPFYALSPNCLFGFADEFLYRFSNKGKKDLLQVRLFKYIRWNEENILSLIQNELKWKTPGCSRSSWRSDCKIHLLKQYLYRETLGFTKNDELLSGMIREGMITREEALRRLESENMISHRFLIGLLDEWGLSFRDLDVALKEYKRVGT